MDNRPHCIHALANSSARYNEIMQIRVHTMSNCRMAYQGPHRVSKMLYEVLPDFLMARDSPKAGSGTGY